ncbi:hypothetical protein ELH98_39795 [Rhizobium ruizarguesonis]|uniref:Uncharacterized protein n=1 Tax=Rhizobium ruizarguesonis TaxID=2081791 RepID=A0ABY1WW67_9HYPH|nr:hypothetical protein ELH98_39795 [Rhizobium ruizarguesonis]
MGVSRSQVRGRARISTLSIRPPLRTFAHGLLVARQHGRQGSGIPQTIVAGHLRDEEVRTRLLSLKIAFGKKC